MRIYSLITALFSVLTLQACGGGATDPVPTQTETPEPTVEPSPSPTPSSTTQPSPTPAVGLNQRPGPLSHNFPLNKPSQTALALELVHSGLSRPIFFAQVPGSDIHLVVEQRGNIRWFNKNDLEASGTFMAVPDTLSTANEEGLLGLAFDPDMENNGYFYLHYTQSIGTSSSCVNEIPRKRSSCSVIARYQLARNGAGEFIPTQGNSASKQAILMQRQPFGNHNGGMISFGPDDYLYIAIGDGGSGGDPDGNSQNRSNLLGNLLRIDVSQLPYTIPSDNPFFGNSLGYREEIWAYGLRNPWRFSFDTPTGTLWLADVGQNQREEVDIITRGGNYGWNFYEATRPFNNADQAPADLIAPITEYGRDEGESITGGYVYRGNALPEWKGWYFYGDFSSGTLWALQIDSADSDELENVEIMSTGLNISSFGIDDQSELYVVDFGGRVYRVVKDDSNSETQLPATLSETGLFDDTENLSAAEGLIPYDVNAPFWSDGAIKRRWFALPADDFMSFSDENQWDLPVGSVTVKHFDMPLLDDDPASAKRLETRVFFHHVKGWFGYTYRWNDDQRDALLLNGRETTDISITQSDNSTRVQRYTFPSRATCFTCHNDTAGRVLGLRTKQTNREFDYGTAIANQLTTFNFINLFEQSILEASRYDHFIDPYNASNSTELRARDYLEVNCAVCHQPSGPTPTDIDLRATTPLSNTNTLDVAPTGGDLGIANASIISRGSKERSILWQRMRAEDENRMPPDVNHRIDEVAVDLIGQWIDEL